MKLFDYNQTIKHKSMSAKRMERAQQDHQTRVFFKAIILLVILVTIALAVLQIAGA